MIFSAVVHFLCALLLILVFRIGCCLQLLSSASAAAGYSLVQKFTFYHIQPFDCLFCSFFLRTFFTYIDGVIVRKFALKMLTTVIIINDKQNHFFSLCCLNRSKRLYDEPSIQNFFI